MRKYIFIAGGLLLFCVFAWAQENKNTNPYTDRMQQLLNKSNANATDQFNRNYPQPKAPTISKGLPGASATVPSAPSAPTTPSWTPPQPQQNSAPADANKNTTNTTPNIYLPANPNNSNQKSSSDSSINIFR